MLSNDQIARELSPKAFNLFLLPTEKCNFRCTYCYEDFAIGRMTPTVRQAVKRFIGLRLEGLRHFSISWFGGEPLLAEEVIDEIGGYAQAECSRRLIAFASDITTNAYRLDGPALQKLIGLGINQFQVSLDGEGEVHDRTRKLANGGGTFEVIWRNLLAMKASHHEFSTKLRVHLTPENLTSVESLVERIAGTFGADKRFHVFFKAIERLGGPGDATMATLEHDRTPEVIARLQSILTGSRVLSSSLAGRSESDSRIGDHTEPYVCYASRPNSLVVRADGTLAKCTVMFADPRNSIGRLNENGTIKLDNDRLAPWMRGFRSLDEDELGCPANGLPQAAERPLTFFPPLTAKPVALSSLKARA